MPSRGCSSAYVSECLTGEHGFYDEVFESLDIPYEPVRWEADANASTTSETAAISAWSSRCTCRR